MLTMIPTRDPNIGKRLGLRDMDPTRGVLEQCDPHRRSRDEMYARRQIAHARYQEQKRKAWAKRAKQAIDRADYDVAANIIDKLLTKNF